MEASGFVLAGGNSSRMGRDKALLEYRGAVLLDHIARLVRAAAGSVTILGDPARYGHLGYPVLADLVPGCGPLSGVVTALHATKTDWNLVVACDLPGLSSDVLQSLLVAAGRSQHRCLAASGPGGALEPLCAVYHRECLPAMERALSEKRLKMQGLLKELEAGTVPVPSAAIANANTLEDWREVQATAE